MTTPRRTLQFHFYWRGPGFQFVHRLALRSFVRCHPGIPVVLHVEAAPEGEPEWQKLADEPGVTVRRLDIVALVRAAGYGDDEFADFFDRAAPNHRSDLVRYLVLLVEGGLYADVDIIVRRSLAELAEAPFFAAYQYYGRGMNYVNGAVMGAPAGSALVRSLVDDVRQRAAAAPIFGWADFGPTLLTKRLMPRSLMATVARKLAATLEGWGQGAGSLADALVRRWLQPREGWLLPRSSFYAVTCFSDEWRRLFARGALPPSAFGIHLWNRQSAAVTAELDDVGLQKMPPSLFRDIVGQYLP